MKKAKLVEVFTSLQGEGTMMGVRQIFIRLAGCNLKCNYCDTDFSYKNKFRLETNPFSKKFEYLVNPIEAQKLLQLVLNLRDKASTEWLALTGGEPLIQADFLTDFLPLAKGESFKIFLETNATLPEEFLKIKHYLDFVSLDIKLPAFCHPESALKKQLNFFKLCSEIKGEAKVVLVSLKSFVKKQSSKTNFDKLVNEFEQKIIIFNKALPDYPLILQPATGFFEPHFEESIEYQDLALKHHSEVKLLPRLHILYNLL